MHAVQAERSRRNAGPGRGATSICRRGESARVFRRCNVNNTIETRILLDPPTASASRPITHSNHSSPGTPYLPSKRARPDSRTLHGHISTASSSSYPTLLAITVPTTAGTPSFHNVPTQRPHPKQPHATLPQLLRHRSRGSTTSWGVSLAETASATTHYH